MRRARRAAAVNLLLTVGLTGSLPVFANLTGTYVAANSHQAFEIQVIETAHKRLIGHYEEIDFNKAAQATTTDASVTGRVAGRLVIMTLQTHTLLSSPVALSGSLRGRHLTLQGGGGGGTVRLFMVKASQAVFIHTVAALRQHAHLLAAAAQKAKQRQERIAADHRLVRRLRKLITIIKTVPVKGRVEIAYLHRADNAYRAITIQMHAAYSHELSIAPYGPYGRSPYAREQVSFWIGQRAFTASNIHFQVNMRRTNDFASMKQFGAIAKEYAQACRARQENPKTASSVAGACVRFLALVPVLKMENAEIVKAFLGARTGWRQQRPEQKTIEMDARRGAA